MIFIDGLPFPSGDSSSSSSSQLGRVLLVHLMEHPTLVSASHAFKSMEERKVSFEKYTSERATNSKYVYLFQREYATVDPALVDFVGTDEATTCVGLVIRNRNSGMTSVAHLDSPEIVELGFTQMLSLVFDKIDAELDVHLIGGFEDMPPKHANYSTMSEDDDIWEGYSFPLCTKIVETLQERRGNFHIHTLFVLGHNTKRDSQGNACPIFNGFLVETSTGFIIPASFDRTSRCPDEIIRRIRVSASFEDRIWNGRLLDTYDTQTDRFVIAPCYWTFRLIQIAFSVLDLSDEEILRSCSTSPSAEGPDFVVNERRISQYLIEQPHWTLTFPRSQPRVFERMAGGDWNRC